MYYFMYKQNNYNLIDIFILFLFLFNGYVRYILVKCEKKILFFIYIFEYLIIYSNRYNFD